MEGQEEKKYQKRKDWIKNAAIIFLIIMLILTFFSNTILNYSLPQVAVQYVTPGSITAKVRGSGTVECNDLYDVMVRDTRKVSSVMKKAGDTVVEGEVLFTLTEADSTELDAAKKEYEAANDAYEAALMSAEITSSTIAGSHAGTSTSTYRDRISAAQKAVNEAETAEKQAKLVVEQIQKQIELSETEEPDYSAEEAAVNAAQQAYNTAKYALDAAQNEVDRLENLIKFYTEDTSGNGSKIEDLKAQLVKAKKTLYKTQASEQTAALNLKKAEDALALKKQATGTNSNVGLKQQLIVANAALADATLVLTEKTSALSELVTDINNQLNLNNLYEAIAEAKKKVDAASSSGVGNEIVAPVSGKISSVNVSSGHDTDPSIAAMVIQPEGKGYTLSFSVKNDQAKILSIGDKAEPVNSWYYSDVTATLLSIKPDKDSPNTQKLLTFSLDGELTEGQSLTLSAGSRSANYDLVVPNSAIKEDNNGKFILTIESKSTPLGNRYIAVRNDVSVLATDDTQSAISAALYGYEYVITTSTKPISAGNQVRLSDN